MRLIAMSLVLVCGGTATADDFVVTNKVPGRFIVRNKMSAAPACPNCTTCGANCKCPGGGYYCPDLVDGTCGKPVAAAPGVVCANGVCGTAQNVQSGTCAGGNCYAAPARRWEPFGGFFRRR